MKRHSLVIGALVLCLSTQAHAGKDLRVFISADMEGVCMATGEKNLVNGGNEYESNRTLMTEEVNAAVQGAVDAGATHVLVRDAHYFGMNIVPDLLHEKAHLIRSYTGGPLNMMEGLDKSFHAAMFVGYHAMSGSPDSAFPHTIWGEKFTKVAINGIKMSEGAINALIAGYFGVPVVLVTGDSAVCEQVRDFVGQLECAVVKEGMGKSTWNVPLKQARKLIRQAAKKGVKNRKSVHPKMLKGPYTVELTLHFPADVVNVMQQPGVKRVSDGVVSYTHADLLEALKFLTNSMYILAGALE